MFLKSTTTNDNMELTVRIIDLTYKVENGKAVIYLFCVTPDGQRVCVRDSTMAPFFWAEGVDSEKLLRLKTAEGWITDVRQEERKLHGVKKKLCKVFANMPKSIPVLSRLVKDQLGAIVYENDILFTRRYLLEKNLFSHKEVVAEGEWIASGLSVPLFEASVVRNGGDNKLGVPRLLALDIETYDSRGRIEPDKNPILMLGLVGDSFRKVVTWKRFSTEDKDIEFVTDETALLLRFKELLDMYQPHMICGYYSDGFDLPYIKKRADVLKVTLNVGLDYSPIFIPEGDDAARITGIPHIDIFKFVKKIMGRSMETEVFSLNAVASELLGEKKHDVDLDMLSKVWDSDPEKLEVYAQYNAQDAALTYKLCRHLWTNMEEFVTLIGLPIETVTRMSYSQLVEQYIFRQAQKHGELAPNKPDDAEMEKRTRMRLKGGFVYEPTPGLYHKVVVLDFRSLYPSIIISHNISPSSFRCSCCPQSHNTVVIAGEHYWFCENARGFLSAILEDVVTKRAQVKKMMKDVSGDEKKLLTSRSEALKLLSNSFYGYLGFAAARWYSFESAEATTAFGRQYIQSVITHAQDTGFSVLYTDTDSIFLQLGDKTKEEAKQFQNAINETLPDMMEMEWENFYPHGIFVALKGALGGAKKRYALVDEKGNMKIRGFETVRRNVAPIAKEVQENVLRIILKEGDVKKAAAYIRQTIKDVGQRKVEKEKMIIFTQLQKDIKQYESISPHVAAATRMQAKGIDIGRGSFISYIVGNGAGKLRDKVKLPEEAGEYDANYYITHQIIPAIGKIMEVFGHKAEDFQNDESQSDLSKFWS